MGDFALAYADQAERDHAALKAAVRAGKINVHGWRRFRSPTRTRAIPLGIANARFYPTKDLADITAEDVQATKPPRQVLGLTAGMPQLPTAYLLAISGGGDNGAFGAGLLTGWTEAGSRPEFNT